MLLVMISALVVVPYGFPLSWLSTFYEPVYHSKINITLVELTRDVAV